MLFYWRVDEAIVINGDITVTVVEIRYGQVRLGIEAPKECPVDRQEVHERKKLNATHGDEAGPSIGTDAF